MSDCRRFGKLFGGCKFVARYDYDPKDIDHYNGSITAFIELAEAMTKRVYVKDICVRCGKTIDRQEQK